MKVKIRGNAPDREARAVSNLLLPGPGLFTNRAAQATRIRGAVSLFRKYSFRRGYRYIEGTAETEWLDTGQQDDIGPGA